MDTLRITLLVIGAVFIALIYAWERIKRGKDQNRYARWGVSDDDTETHIIGRHSGDPETDSRLVASAYEEPAVEEASDLPDDQYEYEPEFNTDDYKSDDPSLDDDASAEAVLNEVDAWQSEVEASLADDAADLAVSDPDVDLESDPELNASPINDITTELEALEEIISNESEPNQMELGDLDVTDEPVAVNEPDRIIAVHVLAREGAVFSGPDILSSLMHLDMQFGHMNIFHRLTSNEQSVFSLANAVEPGVFDLADMDDMQTPALLLIMSLPNPLPALDAFDNMLEAARSLSDSLDGRLCDDRRSVLTRQAIDELRSELSAL